MSKKIFCCLALVSLLCLGGQAFAETCTVDAVPAATLLVPYFEVDLDDDQGITTLFSINNASAAPALAHVTIWTDESIPTLDFDVYLTGFDVQTINVRDIFNGNLPVTAPAGQDPGDVVSPQGPLSDDGPFPGCGALPYNNPTLDSFRVTNLRLAHTGQNAPAYGGCLGANYGDNVARGYITVDTVSQCNLLFPSSSGYFSTGIATNENVLWGDYFFVEPTENFAQGETLVHVEACPTAAGETIYVGEGEECPFITGDYTFYGRYASVAGQDQREPLATTFGTRYLNGGVFDGGTELIVWRDSKTIPTGANGVHACGGAPAWFPLSQSDVVAFNEFEDAADLCQVGDIVSPPFGGTLTCFPLEAQRVSLTGGNVVAEDPAPPFDFGWMYLNLNHTLGASVGVDPYPGVAQAWVTTIMDADGRFSVGFDAIALDSACTAEPGGVVLIP